MALSKHNADHLPDNKNSVQYPHAADDKSFSGNDEHDLLDPTTVIEGKEKYLADLANIEDVRGNGGEPVDEQSANVAGRTNEHQTGTDVDELKSDLNDTNLRGL